MKYIIFKHYSIIRLFSYTSLLQSQPLMDTQKLYCTFLKTSNVGNRSMTMVFIPQCSQIYFLIFNNYFPTQLMEENIQAHRRKNLQSLKQTSTCVSGFCTNHNRNNFLWQSKYPVSTRSTTPNCHATNGVVLLHCLKVSDLLNTLSLAGTCTLFRDIKITINSEFYFFFILLLYTQHAPLQ